MDPAKLKITSFHFNKGKQHVSHCLEAAKMEAKQHDLLFGNDDSEDDSGSVLEVSKHETS